MSPRRRTGWAWARALPALAIWAVGCEALVDGKLGDVHCAQEGVVGPPACPVGLVCKEKLCVPTMLGTPCAADADCSAGDFCLEPAALGGEGSRRCSRACCTSSDCDPDALFMCWSAPHGAGSFCRSAPEIGRAEGGDRRALAACAHGAECRSGLCHDGRCADTCCSDTSCVAEGGACRFGAAPDHEVEGFWCNAPPVEKKPRYATCEADADCASGLCVRFTAGGEQRCSAPCCASSECELSPENGTPVACAPVLVGTTWVRACSLLVSGRADGEVGSPCAADGDCRSGACDDRDGAGRCTDACCSDASCGDPSSFACRPVGKRASWALRCEPK
jgi:hypothetical protein